VRVFNEKSRYAKITPVHVVDARGRIVEAIPPAPHPKQTLRGIHLRKENERPDHLAALYVADPAGYWRLAEQNDAMTAEVLIELREVEIPNPRIEEDKL
jgi:hypothetical protein